MDLVEQHQGQDLAHPRNRVQQIVLLRLVQADGAGQVQLDIVNQFIVPLAELVGPALWVRCDEAGGPAG
jgi:hypothetical protein